MKFNFISFFGFGTILFLFLLLFIMFNISWWMNITITIVFLALFALWIKKKRNRDNELRYIKVSYKSFFNVFLLISSFSLVDMLTTLKFIKFEGLSHESNKLFVYLFNRFGYIGVVIEILKTILTIYVFLYILRSNKKQFEVSSVYLSVLYIFVIIWNLVV